MTTDARRLPRAASHVTTFALALLTVTAASAQRPPILPDPKLTPGATLPVAVQDIAVPEYTKEARDVPQAVKDRVYAEYGITKQGEYMTEAEAMRHGYRHRGRPVGQRTGSRRGRNCRRPLSAGTPTIPQEEISSMMARQGRQHRAR